MADQNNAFDNLTNTPDLTEQFDQTDIQNNKILSLFSYLGILFLVPLLAAKDSKFARFHANQGIALFILSIALNIASFILGIIFGLIKLSFVATIISWMVYGVILVLAIMGIVSAVQGKAKKLPIIGGITILK
ncbi:hypothetical protein LJC61_01410 [Ruminococcaceae bacterium OttesenSCG-928-A16]|nr:hypothetical protein [Ruminococcaceae bacterium OttesenSCG-928-A16]